MGESLSGVRVFFFADIEAAILRRTALGILCPLRDAEILSLVACDSVVPFGLPRRGRLSPIVVGGRFCRGVGGGAGWWLSPIGAGMWRVRS